LPTEPGRSDDRFVGAVRGGLREPGINEGVLALGCGMPAVFEAFLGRLGRVLPGLANAIRRVVIGSLLDTGTGGDALRGELAALLAGHQASQGGARSRAAA
jgi:hypothetical protein